MITSISKLLKKPKIIYLFLETPLTALTIMEISLYRTKIIRKKITSSAREKGSIPVIVLKNCPVILLNPLEYKLSIKLGEKEAV